MTRAIYTQEVARVLGAETIPWLSKHHHRGLSGGGSRGSLAGFSFSASGPCLSARFSGLRLAMVGRIHKQREGLVTAEYAKQAETGILHLRKKLGAR